MLKVGDKAPDFSLPDQNNHLITSTDFRGKKLALYFYPKDNTPGCTKQACNLRNDYEQLKEKGIWVVGVSPDSSRKHKNFEKKYQLPFTLLSDTEHQVAERYGVWGEKKLFGRRYMGIYRTTFLISKEGIIDHVIDRVDVGNHSRQILETWGIAG